MENLEVNRRLLHILYNPVLAYTTSIIGNLIAAFILSIWLYNGGVSFTLVSLWLSGTCIVLALRAISIAVFNTKFKQNYSLVKNVDFWIVCFQSGIFFTAVAWGLVTFLITNIIDHETYHLFITLIHLALTAVVLGSVGMIFRVFASFVIPIFLIPSVYLFIIDGAFHWKIAVVFSAGMIYMLYTSLKLTKQTFDLMQHTIEVEESQLEIIDRLSKAGEYKDNEIGFHMKRMSYSSYLLALEFGFADKDAKKILHTASMHDIGKIGIPDEILLKKGPLTKEEWDIMKTHTTIGSTILYSDKSDLLKLAASIANHHHEKWDGTGYPQGLHHNEIPIEARIVSICDVFDALTSVRPYKEAWSEEDAISFIKNESGKHFDPNLVKRFLTILPDILSFNKNVANDNGLIAVN